jgi:Fe2+ or Zn2+ uptake regulation protein
MNDDPEMTAIVRALAKYLRANPLACDAPDGIIRWWLASQSVSMEKLLQALDWMKQQGLVQEMEAADGRLRYRRSASDELLLLVELGGDTQATKH